MFAVHPTCTFPPVDDEVWQRQGLSGFDFAADVIIHAALRTQSNSRHFWSDTIAFLKKSLDRSQVFGVYNGFSIRFVLEWACHESYSK